MWSGCLEGNCGRVGYCFAIATRRYPTLPGERARQMALIGETSEQRCLRRGVTLCQKPSRQSHAKLHEVGVRGDPDLAHKASQ